MAAFWQIQNFMRYANIYVNYNPTAIAGSELRFHFCKVTMYKARVIISQF